MTKRIETNVEWEMFSDDDFFYMWVVKPVNDKDFNSPRLFHFDLKEDAEAFKTLIEKAHMAVPND
jgi:hypothetical protein